MKILSFCPVWILAAVVAPAPTATNATQDGQRAEEEVRRLNAEEVEAFLKSDPKIMAQLPKAGKAESLRFTGIWMK